MPSMSAELSTDHHQFGSHCPFPLTWNIARAWTRYQSSRRCDVMHVQVIAITEEHAIRVKNRDWNSGYEEWLW